MYSKYVCEILKKTPIFLYISLIKKSFFFQFYKQDVALKG